MLPSVPSQRVDVSAAIARTVRLTNQSMAASNKKIAR
jgi:hypothetical protein